MISAIIFDLDGTLVDTEPAAAQAVNECFQRWGIAISREDAGYITGRTWANAFEFLFKKYPLPLPPSQASDEMLSAYRKAMKTSLAIVAGSATAVNHLSQHWPIALVSGSHRSEILFALDHLGVRSKFKFVLGCEDYRESKPSPEGYLKALEMLGVSGKNTVIFEDSQAGIASARSAGAWVVAISGTNHFSQDISAAHLAIPDLTSVDAAWLTQQIQKLSSPFSAT